jgi:hypothetical protein
MQIINKFLQLIILLTFLMLVYSLSLVGVLSSNQKLTRVLDESGFYESSSKIMAQELNKQISSNSTLLNEAIKNSISSTLTPDVAKSVITPAQVVLVEWLNNKQESISIDLDLLPIKNKVSSKTTDNQIKFEITKLLPDNFLILDSKKDENGVLPQLLRIKEFYLLVNKCVPYLWIILGSVSAVLFLINISSGSKKINRVLSPIFVGSAVGLLIALGSGFASTSIGLDAAPDTGLDNFQLVSKLLLTIARDTFSIFAIIAVVSISGIFVSRFIFRSRDKHLKKKKK